MRIAYDATAAATQTAGVGRYARELLRELVTLDPTDDFQLICAASDADGGRLLQQLPPGVRMRDPGPGFDAGPNAFADTAALMMALDLVVSSDTSVAHLAGALGRPAWVALKHVPDWRWGLERGTTPWYPAMRLFRQPRPGDWSSVFAAMASRLATRQ